MFSSMFCMGIATAELLLFSCGVCCHIGFAHITQPLEVYFHHEQELVFGAKLIFGAKHVYKCLVGNIRRLFARAFAYNASTTDAQSMRFESWTMF